METETFRTRGTVKLKAQPLPAYNPRHLPVVIVENPLAQMPKWLNQPLMQKACERDLVLRLIGIRPRRTTRPRIRVVASSSKVFDQPTKTAVVPLSPLLSFDLKYEAWIAARNGDKERLKQLVFSHQDRFTKEEISELLKSYREALERIETLATQQLVSKLSPVVILPAPPSLRDRLWVFAQRFARPRRAQAA